jgi:hypothetical protein
MVWKREEKKRGQVLKNAKKGYASWRVPHVKLIFVRIKNRANIQRDGTLAKKLVDMELDISVRYQVITIENNIFERVEITIEWNQWRDKIINSYAWKQKGVIIYTLITNENNIPRQNEMTISVQSQEISKTLMT